MTKILTLIFALASNVSALTYTANYNLVKPDAGDRNYVAPFKTTMDTIDTYLYAASTTSANSLKRNPYYDGSQSVTVASASVVGGEFSVGTSTLVVKEGKVGVGTTSPATSLQINSANTATDSLGNVWINSTDAGAINKGGQLNFGGDVNGTTRVFGSIAARKENSTAADRSGYLSLATVNSGAANSEKMRITSAGNVGIGTTAPDHSLSIVSNPASVDNLSLGVYGANASATIINAYKTRGAAWGTSGLVSNNDGVLSIVGRANDGAGFEPVAAIKMQIDGVAANDDMPGRIVFDTTLDGAKTSTERMRITNAGNVGIGTTAPESKLHVAGNGFFSGNLTSSATITAVNFVGSGVGLTGLPGGGDAVLAATQTWSGANSFTSVTATTTFSGWVDWGFNVQTINTGVYTAGRVACGVGYKAISGSCSCISGASVRESFPSSETTSNTSGDVGTPVADGASNSYSWSCDCSGAGGTAFAICARIK